MNTYIIYKAIKAKLAAIAPCYYYTGQYTNGGDKTSYKVPAIYIEMPNYLILTFFRKVETALKAPIRIHFISSAPFKTNDNPIQDAVVADHTAKLLHIDKLLTGWSVRDDKSRLLTQQLIPAETNDNNYIGYNMFSIRTYQADFFSYHLIDV